MKQPAIFQPFRMKMPFSRGKKIYLLGSNKCAAMQTVASGERHAIASDENGDSEWAAYTAEADWVSFFNGTNFPMKLL